MVLPDLFSLQQTYNLQHIMLCFNGPLTKSLIEEIGLALRNYMRQEQVSPSASVDVFGTYIELTQNIRHYAASKGWNDGDSCATVVIARDAEGHYVVSCGNMVEAADGERLAARITELGTLDKAQLKAAYKEQLRKPRAEGAPSGAGLGLLDMARKASAPLVCRLQAVDAARVFFSMHVVM